MTSNRYKSLDVIRGMAALSVFLSHFGPIKLPYLHQLFSRFQLEFLWCSGGLHWGVVLFLVLSGYSIHMQNVNSLNFQISKYFRRRFFRIYPVLVIAILLGYIVDYTFTHRSISQYFHNFLINGFLLTAVMPLEPLFGNRIMDTAIVELLIYISYPFVLKYFKKNMIYVFTFLFLIHILNFGLLTTEVEQSWVQRNFFRLSLYWWIGAFFAEITFNSESKFLKFKKYFLGLVPLMILYFIYYTFSHLINFQGAHIIKSLFVSVLGGILISTIVRAENRSNLKIKFYGFEYLGSISYSLYAIHVPVVFFIYNSSKLNSLNYSIQYFLIWFAVIIVTLFTYFFVEKPFHRIARK